MGLDAVQEAWELWVLEDLEREQKNGGHHGSESQRLAYGLARAFGECLDG
jgi:hypothetical protein